MSVYSDYDGNDGCNDFILFVYPGLYNHVYPGSRCEANVNDCYPNPCSATGTDQCLDLVDSFQCVCNPGYTGIRCEVCTSPPEFIIVHLLSDTSVAVLVHCCFLIHSIVNLSVCRVCDRRHDSDSVSIVQ